jgi:hypothetical protein
MNVSFGLADKLNWLTNTLHFLKTHFKVILGLGLIAAFGRVIQLGGFGAIPVWLNVIMEIIIESARICIFIYVLGFASIKSGFLRIKHFFKQKKNRRQNISIAKQKIKQQWLSVVLNIIVFLIIATAINYLIDQLAYETCLLLTLKKDGILTMDSSEWTILLFFKNISVIPFTLVFDAVFLLWITNKFHKRIYAES